MTENLCVCGPMASMTPAGGGQTPAAEDRPTSLAIHQDEATAVAPPLLDEFPMAADADEINPFHPSQPPFSYAFSIDSDGCLTIKRNGTLIDILHQSATMDLGYFMNGTEKLWGAL